jgi:hypothetical protein
MNRRPPMFHTIVFAEDGLINGERSPGQPLELASFTFVK